jgi:hypothetical protein
MKNENETVEQPEETDYDSSTTYVKNEKTGEWEIRNPAGSIGYNYLY